MPSDTRDVSDSPNAAQARVIEETDDVRDSDAEYALEYPCTCPVCGTSIGSVKVVRMLRSRVNFTSTLPRHGRVVICPKCRVILSASLSIA
jgi:uncharacterized protein (DUF2225 family)